MSSQWLMRNGRVITPESIVENGVVISYDGRLMYVGAEADMPAVITVGNDTVSTAQLPEIDVHGHYIAPGFMDIHIHGGGGADTMHATTEALQTIASTHAAHGTTGLLATTMTATHEAIVAAANAVKLAMTASTAPDWPGSQILGIHVEGPYIHPDMIGAQNPAYVRPASIQELQELYDVLGDGFRLITLAPEQPGAEPAIRWLTARGIAVAMGHTAATHEQALAGIAQGITQATHSFNAMTGLHHREPGVVGTLLTERSLLGQLIADGIHVHPTVMKLLYEAKGAQGVCLITDAMEAMGMPDGRYDLGGLPVVLKDRQCRLESGSLAGSVLAMDEAVARMVFDIGADIVSAVRMASLTPAESIGMEQDRGSLTLGKVSDVVLLDDTLHCVATYVGGVPKYRRD